MNAVTRTTARRGNAAFAATANEIAFASVVLALSLIAASSSAQAPLARAEEHFAQGRLVEAQRAYEDALAGGELDEVSLVRAHERLAVIAERNGDMERAARHVEYALALDPHRGAPEGASDALRESHAELSRERGGRRMMLGLADEDSVLQINVLHAPEGLARTIEVRGRDWERRMPWDGFPLMVEPPQEAFPIEAFLYDGYGNLLARSGPPTIERRITVERPRTLPAQESLIESPWLWVIVGLVVIGAGIAIGVSASGDRFVLGAPVIR